MEDKDELREMAEELWRNSPEDRRARLRERVRHVLAKNAAEMGYPPEVVTPELVEELAIRHMERIQASASARMEEHMTHEDVHQWVEEERARLYVRYRGEVPEDALVDAVTERSRRERPEAHAKRTRKPK